MRIQVNKAAVHVTHLTVTCFKEISPSWSFITYFLFFCYDSNRNLSWDVMIIKKIIFFLIGIVAIGLFLNKTHLGHLLLQGKVDAIAQYISTFGSTAIILAFLFIMIQAFFPYIPFIVLAGVSVLLFGLWGGFLLSWLAASTGAVLAFLTARYLARGWAERKIMHLPIFQKFNSFATKRGFLTILLFRLSTVVPSSGINLAAGISNINRKTFIFATFLGNLPITFAESWLGHFFIHLEKQNVKLVGLIALVFLLLFILYKKIAKRHKA